MNRVARWRPSQAHRDALIEMRRRLVDLQAAAAEEKRRQNVAAMHRVARASRQVNPA